MKEPIQTIGDADILYEFLITFQFHFPANLPACLADKYDHMVILANVM